MRVNWTVLPHLAPYLLSVATSLFVGVYCLWRRSEVGAAAYAGVALSGALWTTTVILELITPDLAGKMFWDDFQNIGAAGASVCFLCFTLAYARPDIKHRIQICAAVSVVWIVLIAYEFAEPQPHARIVPAGRFTALLYDFGYSAWLILGYAYAAYLVCLAILISHYRRSHPLYRKQIAVIVGGSMLPLLGALLTQTILKDQPERDVSPFTFALNNAIVAWGIFRYSLLEVVPVARYTVVDSMSDAVFVLDNRDRVVDVNPAALSLMGRPPSELIGQTAQGVFANWPALHDWRDDKDVDIEVGPEAGDLWLEFRAQRLRDRYGRSGGKVVTIRDVTHRKLLENELREHRDHLESLVAERTADLTAANAKLRSEMAERERLEDQLRQAQKMEAIGRLAGGVAHDFNNLLTAILGYADLLLDDFTADSPHRAAVEEIKDAGERAASLTSQLLAFSRKQRLQPRILDLNQLVANTERLLARLIGEHIQLTVLLQPGLGRVEADPHRIEQAIVNLAINARDAMKEGGRLVIQTRDVCVSEVQAYPIAIDPGWYVMLSVSDTGMGMDQTTRECAFEPFFTTKDTSKGTGLGLAMVYGVVKQSRGHIWIDSQPEQGTTITMLLPRVEREAERLEEGWAPSAAIGGTETILVAEDEQMLRDLAREVLRRHGYEVIEAANGKAALSASEQHIGQIDLLLTDIVMPEMNGRDLAAEILRLRPHLRILFMSGYSEYGDDDRKLPGEKTDFVQKPFTPEILVRKIRQLLDSA
jgi:signal transduction histidine kinase